MKAYSQDLRQRIVRAVDEGQSRAEAARRFSVSERTVRRYLRQRTRTGSLAPVAYRHGPAPAIPPEQEGVLLTQLRAHPDATLEAHCALWEREQGRALSASTMCRAQQRVGWTVKKSR
jgi:transposase